MRPSAEWKPCSTPTENDFHALLWTLTHLNYYVFTFKACPIDGGIPLWTRSSCSFGINFGIVSYHAKCTSTRTIGNLALLQLKTKFRGPAPQGAVDGDKDIIDEALYFFKANVFKSYEVNGPNDRVIIYLTLYTSECLKKLQTCPGRDDGIFSCHAMATLAVSSFDIPRDPTFPLNAFMTKPCSRQEFNRMRQYFIQVRQELGQRLVEKAFTPDDKPSKWWMCFTKRRFMDLSLFGPGM